MSDYLEQVKQGDVLCLGRRNKKEFMIVPTSLLDEEDIEIMQSKHLAQKIAQARREETISLEELATNL
jgi:hypothetical protein